MALEIIWTPLLVATSFRRIPVGNHRMSIGFPNIKETAFEIHRVFSRMPKCFHKICTGCGNAVATVLISTVCPYDFNGFPRVCCGRKSFGNRY